MLGETTIPKRKRDGLSHVPLSALREYEHNERKTYKGISELAASIEERGQLEPLVVEADDDGKYVIISGHRRFRALKKLGAKRARVIIEKERSADDRQLDNMLMNLQREDTPAIDRAETLLAF